MKVELTDKFHEQMILAFPILLDAEKSVEAVTGVSLSGLRSNDRRKMTSMARMIFVEMVSPYVTPQYYVARYIGRDHATILYLKRMYKGNYKFDLAFRSVSDAAFELFNKIKKDGIV